jgi:predicted nucleic acid-binding protein
MTAWLIDRSALTKLGDSLDAERWATRVEHGQVRVSSLTRLEVGCWAKSVEQARRAWTVAPLAVMPVEHLSPAAEKRAIEVQMLLAGERPLGELRAATVPALLIAAIAELAGLTVLHSNDDFDLIGRMTVQPMHRLRIADPEPQLAVSTSQASARPVISRIRITR